MRRVTAQRQPFVQPLTEAPVRSLGTADALNQSYFETKRTLSMPSGKSPVAWQVWRRKLRQALREVLTLDALGKVPVPEFDVLSEEDLGSYVRRKIVYEAVPGHRIPAYLLCPKIPGPRPAVLCPHGHTQGAKDAVVGLADPAGVAYGHEIAERGAVVLAPDNAGMGERDIDAGRKLADSHGCFLAWARLNQMGIDLTGLRVFDLMAGVNLLVSLPEVEDSRIGCAGLSGGCWLSQVLTALDQRIRSVVLSGFFTTFVQTTWHGHCICHHPFRIGLLCDMPDISALIAPRAQFVESGLSDTRYPHEPAYSLVYGAYDRLGVADSIGLHRYRGGHMFNGRKSIPWLIERLSR